MNSSKQSFRGGSKGQRERLQEISESSFAVWFGDSGTAKTTGDRTGRVRANDGEASFGRTRMEKISNENIRDMT